MAFRLAEEAWAASIRRPAAAVLICIVLVAGIAIGLGVRLFGSIQELRASVTHANEEIAAAGQVLDALQDAETGQRGFLLTMRPSYLEPYWNSTTGLDLGLKRLEGLAASTPWLQPEVAALTDSARQKMAELDRTVQLALTQGQQAALSVVLSDAGKAAMDSVRTRVAEIITRASAERDTRAAQLVEHEQRVLYGMLGATIAGLLLLGLALLGLLLGRTRLIETEKALRLQSDRLRSTVDHIPGGIAVFDAENKLLLWNAVFFPVSGLPLALGNAGTPFSAFAAAARDWIPPLLSDRRPDRLPRTSEVHRAEAVLEVWRSPMPDGGQMLSVADITRRSHAEAIARQAQKMDALGQLTGGVAHDFNNLLQVVSANLELMEAGVGADERLRARLSSAQAAVERGARLTRHLLAFARRQPLAPQTIDLARLLHDMEDLLRSALGASMRVELVIAGGLWAVRADPQQLENVVLNLAINARDAIQARPDAAEARITIEACNTSLDAAYAAENAEVSPGQYVLVAVTDTGIGMTETEIARAAEPFYTTKPEGQGTGLGLSMVYGFVKQSAGHFKIYSEAGHGTTVKIYLPRAYATPVASAESTPEIERAHGETVLVVEDDKDVRAASVACLIGLGYRVLQAENGEEALALLRSGHRPDILFSDVVIPGTPDGRELAATARDICPNIGVLFTSGYTPNAVVHNGQLEPGVRLLTKPWLAEDLARQLRAALSDRAQTERPSPPLRVLLVEDDPLVRMTTADLLANMGHEVLEAATGKEALRAMDKGADLIITDLGLPDMDGRRLIREVRERQPGIRIVVASGQNDAEEDDPKLVWLPKPYDEAMLRGALE